MKIAVVGGGSTYTPELLHGLALRASSLGIDSIALHDLDAKRLETVGAFAGRMCAALAPDLSITRHVTLEEAVSQARFVILQIRVGGQQARLEDERLGRNFGVIGQETTGVGGLAKALRTIPSVLDIAQRTARVAPSATLINFTNPVSIVTEALQRYSKLEVIGLCNIPLSQRVELAKHLAVDPSEVSVDSVGLNHLSFVRSVTVRDRDVLPELIRDVSKLLASGQRPANIPDLDFPAELLESLEMIPSDYLRYYFLERETVEEQRAKRPRAEEVMAIEQELMTYYADEQNHEKPEQLARRGGAHYSHAAIEIIEAMTTDRASTLVVDVPNGQTLPELPRDACIEVPCRVDAQGAHPLPQRPLEPAIRGLIQHVKCYEQLAIEAALGRSRRLLYLALVTHPLTPSAEAASRITDILMDRLSWS